MNTKNYFFKIMIVAAAISVASCNKNVLDENLTTARSLEYYKTDAGIQSLAVGTYYQVFSTPFNGEFHYSSTNYGTDEFKTGGDNSNGVWNAYDAGLKPVECLVVDFREFGQFNHKVIEEELRNLEIPYYTSVFEIWVVEYKVNINKIFVHKLNKQTRKFITTNLKL